MKKNNGSDNQLGLNGVAQIVAQEEHNEMQYTELRSQIYWFRRRAPIPLKAGMSIDLDTVRTTVQKSGYVRFSLKTRDRKEAAKKARKYSYCLDEVAEQWSTQTSTPPSRSHLTQEDIIHAAESMYAMLLAADDETAQSSLQSCFSPEEAGDIREPDRYLLSLSDLPPPSTMGQAQLLKKLQPIISFFLIQTTGKFITEVTPELVPFADFFRRYVSALEKRKASELVPTPPLPVNKAKWSWEDTYTYYLSQRPGLSDSTKFNYATAWKSLQANAKCFPADLMIDHVVTWRDKLLNSLNPRTVKARLTQCAAIWRESWVNQKIPRSTLDPFQGLRVRVDTQAGTSRQEFSDDELSKIFATSPLHTARAVSVHAGYWLPLLALYHGARLEELTGLEVADLVENQGYLLLHIRENSIRPRLKHRKHSERSFPVHPKLLELGFADYVKAARVAEITALFPSFSRGDTFGEEFVTHTKSLLSPAVGRLVGMHCFRHNFETARRNSRMDSSVANYITGRRIDVGSAALYGSPAGKAVLNIELSKIEFGINHLSPPAVTSQELVRQNKARMRTKR